MNTPKNFVKIVTHPPHLLQCHTALEASFSHTSTPAVKRWPGFISTYYPMVPLAHLACQIRNASFMKEFFTG